MGDREDILSFDEGLRGLIEELRIFEGTKIRWNKIFRWIHSCIGVLISTYEVYSLFKIRAAYGMDFKAVGVAFIILFSVWESRRVINRNCKLVNCGCPKNMDKFFSLSIDGRN